MSGIAKDDLVLTDGSGQQVGTYPQKAKSIQKQAAIKKMKNNTSSDVSEETGIEAEDSIEAGLSTAMQGGSVLDIANTVGQAAVMSQVGGAVKAGAAAYKAAAAKAAAAKAAGTTAAASGAGAAGLKAGVMAVNPAVLAGAAAIGLVAGASAKRKRKRMAQARALEEKSLGKQKEAQVFGELSKSIKGMLS